MIFSSIAYQSVPDKVTVSIDARNYYGARHGIETFFQAISFDNVDPKYVMLSDVNIEDEHHRPRL